MLALPRGGVPVGWEVSRTLDCDLDIILVAKVGVPGQPELALGAVGEGGAVTRNDELSRILGITDAEFAALADLAAGELSEKSRSYRGSRPRLPTDGRTVIVVDDGVATGASLRVALDVVSAEPAVGTWVGLPVASRDGIKGVESTVDKVVVVQVPRRFGAVGNWYRDFSQVDTETVIDLLASSRS